ncbi:hypothetical protein [Streptomyces litmocidini]|uniref:Uncharacterized protein n=1 Tax=Streptomyces litmocidini TaxID=67318 RepID=A0ABW7UF97_9ACTN
MKVCSVCTRVGAADAAVSTQYASDDCTFMNCSEGGLIMNDHAVTISGSGSPSDCWARFYGGIYNRDDTTVSYNSGYAYHSHFIPRYWSCASSANLDTTLKNSNASSYFA